MQLTLTRSKDNDEQGTKGVLTNSKGETICNTLELPYRNNQSYISCIPCGEYKVIKHKSNSKGECFKLLNTGARTEILIHTANFSGNIDLGYYSELEGCIAPCESYIQESPKNAMPRNPKAQLYPNKQLMGIGSRNAFNMLKALVDYNNVAFGEEVFILTIKE